MALDFWIVLQWWGTLFLVGAVAWPVTKRLFERSMTGPGPVSWWDEGYLFSKAVGMAVVTWIVYVLGTARILPFSAASIWVGLVVVFLVGLWGNRGNQSDREDQGDKGWKRKAMVMALEELFFLAALLFWSWIKGHEPSIRGLEKFMDFGFMQSILNSQYFPPADMWYAGSPINYYYFGHMVVAVLTRLSGLDLAYTFNLMLATIFALTMTMSFSIGYQLIFICHSREGGNPVLLKKKDGSPIRSGMTRIFSGLLTAFLVTLAGNLQTLYAFTRGYTGDNVKPFWELAWNIWSRGAGSSFAGEIWGKLGEGFNTYWYANATRFIPFTIHEFPGYSFVVSDVHGHVLSIPFVLLAIAILITMSLRGVPPHRRDDAAIFNNRLLRRTNGLAMTNIVFYGFLVGVLLMTNALDGPIYFGLFIFLTLIHGKRDWRQIALLVGGVLLIAGITSLPFLIHFKSFVTGVAVNCPPSFLANTKFGPIIFEGVEKCQISPLWMWWLLWGFFVYSVCPLLFRHSGLRAGIQSKEDGSRVKPGMTVEKLLIVFFVFALALVIFPEFFYFKDIYPAHFRSNTMFKLGYEAFILFSIVAGYTIASFVMSFPRRRESIFLGLDPRLRGDDKKDGGDDKWGIFWKLLFLVFLLPQLFLVSIFPIFAVRSYFNGLKTYEGIYGFNWMMREYPTDYLAIQWLNNQNVKCQMSNVKCDRFAIVEADGDSYTNSARLSAFTGHPTIIGWAVHEWLWRGTYDVVAPRREEVRQIYESEDPELTETILTKYGVRYVIVGKLEREKYKSLQEWKFGELGREIFRSGETVIYATY
ncbi:MAG: DUF2298 domain-containing protein [Patescibacteria group bacterium]